MTESVCVVCAATFAYQSCGGRQRRYCSDRCRKAQAVIRNRQEREQYKTKHGVLQTKKYRRDCVRCGSPVVSRRPDTKYCSKTCGAHAALPALRAADYKPPKQPQALTQCRWCNALHATGKAYCCRDCLSKGEEARYRTAMSPLRVAIADQQWEVVIEQLRLRTRRIEPSGCWNWTGRLNRNGYPVLRYGRGDGRKDFGVHRLMLEAKYAAPLGSQAAHHKCANSQCINPDHLQPVTHRDNTVEMLQRTSYIERIRELETALRQLDPNHALLGVIKVA